MYRNIMDVLLALAREIVENDMKIEDAIIKIDDSGLNLDHIREELSVIERTSLMSDEEADALKSLLIYLLMRNTDLDHDDIYAMVFGSGRTILWN
ncbi:hypothetical protein BMS3Abin07_01987 [bacterium BMS3Abin07]|nr:hypothetical protein BMS3Abin07_01987 [bacterium BMS3Abin07]GBE32432.1 hypothetical protein BMS3Bbin05_01347 [bacterium BMS3Bbin05]HDL21387.1 hypothetical protein [Nitrospirota bacterium]HDO22168.1 hypothetical protein [Nitrospirota bacterium]HDZ87936.1 hypothetical protein [Nitrospirota bacterium]